MTESHVKRFKLHVWSTVVVSCMFLFRHTSAQAKLRDPNIVREYCEWEKFQPNCSQGEVVVMSSAVYGRMRLGRCVEAGLGFLGCSADVLHLADAKCSGRRQCDITIPDKDFATTRPCNKELKVYLEASYVCLRVADAERGCTVTVSNSGASSYIPSLSTSESGTRCGSRAQPWLIEAEPGQHLILSLIDFATNVDDRPPPAGDDVPARDQGPAATGRQPGFMQRQQQQRSSTALDSMEEESCRAVYGYIIDSEAVERNVTLCGGGSDRERQVYVSEGYALQLESIVVPAAEAGLKFLIKVEATGCADLRPPQDAWMKRNNDDLVVGCHSTSQTWHLRCTGRRWSGVIGNCSAHFGVARKEALINRYEETLPHLMTIAMVAGIAVTMSSLIVCVGIVCFRRYARQERMKQQYAVVAAADKLYSEGTAGPDDVTTVGASYSKSGPATDYMHVWQLPLPQPEEEFGGTSGVTFPAHCQSLSPPPTYAKSECAYSIGSVDNRYFVLDHNPSNAATGHGNLDDNDNM